MLHELWDEGGGEQTFCLAGPRGDAARALLQPGSKLIWTVEASSYFEAMTLYYRYMDWGEYVTDFPELDHVPYTRQGIE